MKPANSDTPGLGADNRNGWFDLMDLLQEAGFGNPLDLSWIIDRLSADREITQ